MKEKTTYKTNEELQQEIEELRYQLSEANDTIEAIRTGQIDALVVQGEKGHQLYTLKTADHSYRIFIEKMTEGAITLNTDGLILYCNSQFASMVDSPLSDVIGRSFEEFLAEDNKESYKELFVKCWTDDCKGEVLLVAGSSKTPVQLSLTALEMDEGVSLSIILTDLTAQKKTQQQLQENNRQLEEINRALEISNHDLQQFASIASHDLQEPLRKIQIFSHLMQQKIEEFPQESKKHLQKIVDSSARMKTLIIDILNYSKLSALHFKLECIDLNQIVDELRDDFELLIEEKKARIVTSNLPCVEVNKGQIRQVFQNIISNALKFAKDDVQPVIEITGKRIAEKNFSSAVQEDGAYCFISIKDNGIGFNQKYVGHIFSLFERLNTKDRYEGSGIGLAIAKKIIEKHNGIITAIGNEGSGAEFQIILPMVGTNHQP